MLAVQSTAGEVVNIGQVTKIGFSKLCTFEFNITFCVVSTDVPRQGLQMAKPPNDWPMCFISFGLLQAVCLIASPQFPFWNI